MLTLFKVYIVFAVCERGGFPCEDGMCIPADKICNGEADCGDASDEANCTCCRVSK